MPVTCRIVSTTSKNPLLAVAIDIDFEELNQLVRRGDTLLSSSPQPGINVFEVDSVIGGGRSTSETAVRDQFLAHPPWL
jgi:hypothetical protein